MDKLKLSDILPIFRAEQLDCMGLIPLSACRLHRRYLLEKANISPDGEGSVIMIALPYCGNEPAPNLSRYAISADYHHIAENLLDRLIAALKPRYPNAHFVGFVDHSPIDERHAAASAGLGIIGDHGLLITERYSSYVFLCEIITDLPADASPMPIESCRHCGACAHACPVGLDVSRCCSAVTQKKGELSTDEIALLRTVGSVWGCDICQEACPHTQHARESGTICSPLLAFAEDRISHLNSAVIEAMDDRQFAHRAYAWRGRQTILRNLHLLEEENLPCPLIEQ